MLEWKKQLKDKITTVEELKKYYDISLKTEKEIEEVIKKYKMGISHYYAKLLNKEGIYKQAVPSIGELEDDELLRDDPLVEEENSPVPRLVHKYPDRVIIFASDICFMYCRHCTRKNTVISGNSIITKEEIEKIVEYLKNTPQISDVLITGGDPLTLDDDLLENIISKIREVKHISTIRIGTRAMVTAPMRITEELATMIAKYHPVWINTHFNHPSEITAESKKACDILLSKGIPLGNQSVLLKGVNDDKETMRELLLKLISIRVRPYYLYQCDYVKGVKHLMTDYRVGMDIIGRLWGQISGYAIPKFIIDVPGMGGKIIVEPNNILEKSDEKLVLRGFTGEEVEYKLIKIDKE